MKTAENDDGVDTGLEGLNSYALIAAKLGVTDSAVVYYPCCGSDDYPQAGFPNNRFIYVDGNQQNITALQTAGKEAYCQDARTFDPVAGGVDIVVVQNPMLSSLEFVDRVKTGGIIICNDYHASAKTLVREPSVELVAVIHNPRSVAPEWNESRAQACFEKGVTTADLFEAGCLAYCEKMVARYGADIEGDNVATKYQALYNRHFDSESGFAVVGDVAQGGIFLAAPPTKHIFAPDDIAIFRKKLVTHEQKEARIEVAIQELAIVLPEVIESWITSSLQRAIGISLVADSVESLVAVLRQSALTLVQLQALQGVTQYFNLREYWKLKFQCLTNDQRWRFKFNLEVGSAVLGDSAFDATLSESATLDEIFFRSDANPQTE